MTDRALLGVSAATTMFEALSDDAKAELGELLEEIADDALAVQRGAVPVDTGAVKEGLAEQVVVDQLRARIGLLGLSKGQTNLFYGRIVDHGVRAQVVQRRAPRRRGAKGGLPRRRASDVVRTYTLRVAARAPVEFIEAPDLGAIAGSKLDAFWDRLEAKAGAA